MSAPLSTATPPPSAGTARFPCTRMQIDHLRRYPSDSPSGTGTIAIRWRLIGPMRDQTLEQALQALLDRHEILRTAFTAASDEHEQLVQAAAIKLATFDLTRLTTEDMASQAERIADSDGCRPFDTATAPLMRATLIRLATEEAMLLLTFHQCIIDGWSIGIVARELAALIDTFERRSPDTLPEPEMQFGDYAAWQSACLESGALDKERAYWRNRLHNAPDARIPAVLSHGGGPDDAGRITSIALDETFTASLARAVEREGRTAFVFALACLAEVVGRAAGADDLVIGTQVACRDDEILFGLVGPVVNTVPLRLDLAGHAAWRDLLGHCQTRVAEAFENEALPFADIATAAGSDPLPIRVNLGYQPANIDTNDTGSIRCGEVELVSVPSVSTGALYDLGFFMVRRRDGWRISCEYATSRYDDAYVRSLLEEWRVGLDRLTGAAAVEQEVHPHGQQPLARSLKAPQQNRPKEPAKEPKREYFDLFAMQPAGDLPPVFAFNNRSAYYPIARWFGRSRPFVDIQWREDATPPQLSEDSIPEIAAHAAKLVRGFDPVGPYYFMGHCQMGNVAFETARQLRASGSEVAMIFLLDTIAPGYVESMPRHDRILRRIQLLDHTWHHFRQLMGDVRKRNMTMRAALSHYSFLRNNPLVRLGRRLGIVGPAASAGEDLMNHGLMNYLQDAKGLYRIEPYDGDVVFFRSAEARSGRLFSRGFGWERIATGSFSVYDIPGAHLHMTREPGASAIATHAAWLMDRREGRWRLPDQTP